MAQDQTGRSGYFRDSEPSYFQPMKITAPIRPAAWSTRLPSATLLLLTPLVCAASSLWAQTQTPQAQRPAATAPRSGLATTAATGSAAKHALNVDYVGGKLSVTASDDSL